MKSTITMFSVFAGHRLIQERKINTGETVVFGKIIKDNGLLRQCLPDFSHYLQ